MTECNAIIEANNEIDELKRENKKLNELCVKYGFEVGRLEEENEQLKQQIGNLEHTRDFCAECCERLEKENEELKSEIRKVQRAYEQLWEHTYK